MLLASRGGLPDAGGGILAFVSLPALAAFAAWIARDITAPGQHARAVQAEHRQPHRTHVTAEHRHHTLSHLDVPDACRPVERRRHQVSRIATETEIADI